jgi:hypothetical protein
VLLRDFSEQRRPGLSPALSPSWLSSCTAAIGSGLTSTSCSLDDRERRAFGEAAPLTLQELAQRHLWPRYLVPHVQRRLARVHIHLKSRRDDSTSPTNTRLRRRRPCIVV